MCEGNWIGMYKKFVPTYLPIYLINKPILKKKKFKKFGLACTKVYTYLPN